MASGAINPPLDPKLFNIDILILNDENTRYVREVKSPMIFEVGSTLFHPEGLFSTQIFGPVGSKIRNQKEAYIDLRLPIIHPLVYETIISLSNKYAKIIEGRNYAVFDKSIGDFELTDGKEGDTGYTFFVSNLDHIRYKENDSEERSFKLKLVKKYGNTKSMMSKWLVIPAGLRDYTEDEKGQPSEDEINSIYRKLLSTASMIRNTRIPDSDLRLLDPIRLNLQRGVNELYNYLKSLLDGKHKFIQGKFTSRTVQYGTRNVITPIPAKITDLTKHNNITTNHTVVGLYQYIKAIAPITMNRVLTLFINKVLTHDTDNAYLINPKTMKTELVQVQVKKRDEWLSMDGLNDIMNKLQYEDVIKEPVVIDKYYLFMLRDTGNSITIYKHTSDIPDDVNPKELRPITYIELFYLAIYDVKDKYPGFFTRYPVAGLGGIYPTKLYVKTTTVGREVEYRYNTEHKMVNEYPILDEAITRSMSPATNKLARLGADFDGDMCSLSVLFTEESIKEINKYLDSKEAYITPSNEIINSSDDDVVGLVMAYLTDN